MQHVFAGNSETAALMRSIDWAATPIGPVETWPHSLKVLVRTLLTSRYPMVLTWGPDFIQFYNDAYSEFIGSKHPEAMGIDIRITLAESWDILGPMIEDVMKTGTANWTPALPLLLERSGYPEESYFTVSHAPAEDDEGKIVGMLAVCTEVTQQVLGERRLRLLRDLGSRGSSIRSVDDVCRELTATIAEHPLDVPFALIYLRDGDGEALTLHATVGIEAGQNVSPPTVDPARESDHAWPFAAASSGATVVVDNLSQRLALTGGLWQDPLQRALVMPIIGPGQTVPLGVLVAGVSPSRALDEGYSSFYELLAAQVSAAIYNAQAYEQERQRAEALAELDRAKTTFFNNISHEFRTPLTLILGPAEDALADAGSTLAEAQRHRLELIHGNAQRLFKLVNTLLDFSRLEAGRVTATYEPTDLGAVTADLISLFRSAIERAGLSLTVEIERLPGPVYVDREMWEKIVLNLLSNAVKYTLRGGIRVRLASAGGSATLTVSDTGSGIPADQLPHLFKRFHRVEGAEARSHEGSGIGLALVQELTKLHGGEVSVDSTPGQGSTFTVSIPMGRSHLPAEQIREAGPHAPAIGAAPFVEEAVRWLPGAANDETVPALPPKHPPHQQQIDTGTAPHRRARILLADDNADLRDYVAGLLRPTYAVETVVDGVAALKAARERKPDLILTDVMMPRLDGFGLLRELRASASTSDIPVIMLSARAGEEATLEGLEAGVDDYLVKPFSARELRTRVQSRLEILAMRRQLIEQEQALAVLEELKSTQAALRAHNGDNAAPTGGYIGSGEGTGDPGSRRDSARARRHRAGRRSRLGHAPHAGARDP
jgi:signal transduction histidine kinase/DNA-binding NarL/FixJ family response regulator